MGLGTRSSQLDFGVTVRWIQINAFVSLSLTFMKVTSCVHYAMELNTTGNTVVCGMGLVHDMI